MLVAASLRLTDRIGDLPNSLEEETNLIPEDWLVWFRERLFGRAVVARWLYEYLAIVGASNLKVRQPVSLFVHLVYFRPRTSLHRARSNHTRSSVHGT